MLEGATVSALTRRQKGYLAQLATRAFNLEVARARGRECGEMRSDAAAQEAWRHEEVGKACGKEGLRCCSQLDYRAVEGHFLGLLGETKRAFSAHLASATEGRRQAEAVLSRELTRAGLSPGYVETICQRQYRCSVLDAGEKQLWSLVYTVRNRAAARRRKEAAL
jgi:hypothetical protein